MDQLHDLEVPRSLSEVCRPQNLGLIVYDMQVGILEQIADREEVIRNVGEVPFALRGAGVAAVAIVGVAAQIGIARG